MDCFRVADRSFSKPIVLLFMVDMRSLLALASCVALSAGDFAGLRQLEENNRMFELRAELDRRGENLGELLLFRAITSSRFGSEHEAIGQFGKFLATKPAPDLERKARYELSWALTRLGEYGQAATEMGAALRLTSEAEGGHEDRENIHRLLETLNGVVKQTVEFGPPTPAKRMLPFGRGSAAGRGGRRQSRGSRDAQFISRLIPMVMYD
jgi:hypothetical protein